MRLLFLTPAYPPFPGGGERYVRSLALGLVAQGHEVTAVTTTAVTEQDFWAGTAASTPLREVQAGVSLIRCSLRPFAGGRAGLMAWRKAMVLISMLPGRQTAVLNQMAKQIPPISQLNETVSDLSPDFDVVHGFNISWEHTMVAGWLWAKANQIPFVATPFAHLGTGDDKVARNSTMDHQLQLLQEADRVLVLTDIEKRELAQRGMPSSQLDVIYGGLDPLPAQTDTAVGREKYGIDTPYVIFVGRASFDKGALHAAQAVLQLSQTGTAVTLLLVGQSSPEFKRFYEQLTENEQKWIRPLGIVSDKEKHSLIAESVCLLLPSRTDSFGIVILEAWAHGKPVIAANAGGIPGVVDDGVNGLLVPFADVAALAGTIQTVLKDRVLSEKLGKYGQKKVSTMFSWEQVTQRVLLNYQMMLEKKDKV